MSVMFCAFQRYLICHTFTFLFTFKFEWKKSSKLQNLLRNFWRIRNRPVLNIPFTNRFLVNADFNFKSSLAKSTKLVCQIIRISLNCVSIDCEISPKLFFSQKSCNPGTASVSTSSQCWLYFSTSRTSLADSKTNRTIASHHIANWSSTNSQSFIHLTESSVTFKDAIFRSKYPNIRMEKQDRGIVQHKSHISWHWICRWQRKQEFLQFKRRTSSTQPSVCVCKVHCICCWQLFFSLQ